MIDQRTTYAPRAAEHLPDSARKPVRKVIAVREKSPAYGEMRTSRLETNTERNSVRTKAGRSATGAEMIARARSTMRPEAFEIFIRRLTATLPR